MDQKMDSFLMHYGVKGQKYGIRRYQNEDGTLTEEGKEHYGIGDGREYSYNQGEKTYSKAGTVLSGIGSLVFGGNAIRRVIAHPLLKSFGATRGTRVLNTLLTVANASASVALGKRFLAGLSDGKPKEDSGNSKFEVAISKVDDIRKRSIKYQS